MNALINLVPITALEPSEVAPPAPAPVGWWKSGFDLTAAAVLLLVAAPVIAVAAVAVRLTSTGPAFYRQTRVGVNGRRFVMWKLRSMTHNCEAVSGIRWASKNDSRVTPVGRVLRATHVDELPQLWNVLRGEMSLVGPRPERPEIAASLARAIPGYDERHRVKPGMTGLAQILFPPDTSLDCVRRKVTADRQYIDGLGPWLEVRVLLGTVLHLAKLPGPVVARCLGLPQPAGCP